MQKTRNILLFPVQIHSMEQVYTLQNILKKLMQDFAVYFDSDKYQYKEADIFAATYRTNNLKLMGAQ